LIETILIYFNIFAAHVKNDKTLSCKKNNINYKFIKYLKKIYIYINYYFLFLNIYKYYIYKYYKTAEQNNFHISNLYLMYLCTFDLCTPDVHFK